MVKVQVFRTPSTAPVQATQDAGCRCIKTAPGHAGALKPLLDQICCNCVAHSGEENLDGEKYLAQVRAWRNIREFNFFAKLSLHVISLQKISLEKSIDFEKLLAQG